MYPKAIKIVKEDTNADSPIWNDRRHKAPKPTLYMHVKQEGTGMSNFPYYEMALTMQKLSVDKVSLSLPEGKTCSRSVM